MATRSKKGLDIHHKKVVNTVFIVVSLAILAFLVVIVKTTTFTNNSEAAGRKANLNKLKQQTKKNLLTNSTGSGFDGGCKTLFNQKFPKYNVYSVRDGDVYYRDSVHTCSNIASIYYEGFVKDEVGHTDLGKCCVNLSYMYNANDSICGYNFTSGGAASVIRCKSSCTTAYGNDLKNEFKTKFNGTCDTAYGNSQSLLDSKDIYSNAGSCCFR